MAQFTANPQRFDPYKNFKFRVKWDGKYVAGVSKCGMLKRTTEVVKHREGGDPSSSRKSPGRTEFDAITLERGVTHDVAFEQWANKVWQIGAGLGAEVSLKDFRKDITIEIYNEAGQLAIAYKVYRCWVSEYQAIARSRCQRQRRSDPAYQAGERRMGARSERYGTDGTFLHRAGGWVTVHAPTVGSRSSEHLGARTRTELPFERALAILSVAIPNLPRQTWRALASAVGMPVCCDYANGHSVRIWRLWPPVRRVGRR